MGDGRSSSNHSIINLLASSSTMSYMSYRILYWDDVQPGTYGNPVVPPGTYGIPELVLEVCLILCHMRQGGRVPMCLSDQRVWYPMTVFLTQWTVLMLLSEMKWYQMIWIEMKQMLMNVPMWTATCTDFTRWIKTPACCKRLCTDNLCGPWLTVISIHWSLD